VIEDVEKYTVCHHSWMLVTFKWTDFRW